MAEQSPIVFADTLMGVKLVNGVVRISLGSVEDENKVERAGTLILPLNRFHGMARSLVDGANELISKVREAHGRVESAPEGKTEAADISNEPSSRDPGNGSNKARPSTKR
jgi:hypothetical protein